MNAVYHEDYHIAGELAIKLSNGGMPVLLRNRTSF